MKIYHHLNSDFKDGFKVGVETEIYLLVLGLFVRWSKVNVTTVFFVEVLKVSVDVCLGVCVDVWKTG